MHFRDHRSVPLWGTAINQTLHVINQVRKMRKLFSEQLLQAGVHLITNKKVLLRMKLTAFVLLIACLQAGAEGNAQSITYSGKDVSLKKVFSEIRKQSGYAVFYNYRILEDVGKVTIDVHQATIEETLDKALSGKGLDYTIEEKTIVISKKTVLSGYRVAVMPETVPVEIPPVTIRGRITDEQGNVLPGASVSVKGANKTAIADGEGVFTIEANTGDRLEISFVGFETRQILVAKETDLRITLKAANAGLNEVVVVGYGTQKKINLSGAVDVVTSKDIEDRPVNNAIEALQGLAPNLNLSVGNEGGEPGAKHNLNIRGIGSINGSGGTPYILIDGIEGDLYRINPSDIESISILKDASASAIYGARAAFGVILVTTKKGSTNGTSINYSNNLSFSDPVALPKIVNSVAWAGYFNLASVNDGDSPIFSEETIEKMKKYQAGELKDWTEPYDVAPMFWKSYQDSWANTDWYKEEYRRWAPKSTHSISVSGGNEKTQFYISGATFNQKGLIKWGDDKYVRNNLNAKINTRINSWLRANFQTQYNNSELNGPSYNTDLWYHNIFRRWPTNGVYAPDGTLFYEMEQIWLKEGGRRKTENTQLYITPGLEIELMKGLVIHANYRYRKSSENLSQHNSKLKALLATGEEAYLEPNNSIIKGNSEEVYNSPNVYVNFNKKAGIHEFTLLAGYEQEVVNYTSASSRKDDLITDNVPSMSTATGREYASGNEGHWATQSYFGRLNYGLNDKYLLELSVRRDGTSKFASGKRFGNFPSASVAYVISKERFFEPLSKHINFMKFRASYGSLGNQDVANYLYIESLPIATRLAYVLDNGRPNYAGMPGISSPDLTWEKVNTVNFGIEMGFLNNRLTGSFDYYTRKTLDMLGPVEALPALLGTPVPQTNNATLRTNGFEVSLKWQDQIQQLHYSVAFMLSDNLSKVLDYYNPQGILSAPFYKGKTLGEIWGYQTVGLFQSDEDAKKVDQSYLSRETWRGGDVHYADLNGDGKIDIGMNTVSSSGDLMIIGNSTPRYSYSFLLNTSWKGIGLNMILQGIGKRDLWLTGAEFWGASGGIWQATVFEQHLDYWTPENPTAWFPTPYLRKGVKNQQVQTRYLQDGSYLRLKSLRVHYSFPAFLTKKAFIKNLKVFATGENILTFTRLAKSFDPEGTFGYWGSGQTYPIQKTVSTGVNITF